MWLFKNEKNTEKPVPAKNSLAGGNKKIVKVYPITCPFCGEQFQPNEVLFAFSRGVIEKDKELTAAEKKERVYYSINDSSCLVHYSCGMPMRMIHNDSKAVSVVRVCRNEKCHQVLSPNSGLYEMGKGIFFLGIRNSGKTVMLTTVIQTLKDIAHHYGATFNYYNAEVGQKYEENYYKPLYLEHTLPKATIRGKSDLLVYEWVSKEQSTTISFYDIAGEDASIEEILVEEAGTQISNSKSYILIVDPYEINYISNLKKQNSATYKRATDIFNNVISKVVLPDERAEKFLSIVMTKSDDLINIGDDPLFQWNSGNISNIYCNTDHSTGKFNVRERASIGTDINKFFKDKAADIVSNANNLFDKQNIGYFMVSALGMPPVQEDDRFKIPTDPMPRRVEEPILWLLYKMGYIDGDL